MNERLRSAVSALGTPMTLVNHGAVAEKAGIPRQVLSELLHGKRELTRYYAVRLAPVLKVSAGYLLGTEELPEDAA